MLRRLNGQDFHVELEGNGPPLVLLHGFTGSSRSWDEVRPRLIRFATVVSVDLIGHGESASPPEIERYTLDWAVHDLVALLDALDLERVDVLGYSMGGRVALRFALDRPDRVRRLVLESASPGIQDETERRRRFDSDSALAERILQRGIATFVAEWEQQPLLRSMPHVSTERLEAQRAVRLKQNPMGLANSLRGMGAGAQPPLWSRLAEIGCTVQLIVGEKDPRYVAIAGRMQALLPRGDVVDVAEAGHTVHLDQPERFADLLARALDDVLTTN